MHKVVFLEYFSQSCVILRITLRKIGTGRKRPTYEKLRYLISLQFLPLLAGVMEVHFSPTQTDKTDAEIYVVLFYDDEMAIKVVICQSNQTSDNCL